MDRIWTIAADGSGMYRSIQAAVDALPDIPEEERVIFQIAPGTYREKIWFSRPNVTFRGTSPEEVVIVWNDGSDVLDENGQPMGTQRTATLHVEGDGLRLENLTIQNDYGYGRNEGRFCGQAIAAALESDRAVVLNCRFLGSQDTLYVGTCGLGHRQYYKDCYILGDVDFIFGGGNIYFEHCTIESIDRGNNFTVEDVEGTFNGYLTAASSTEEEIGFVFQDCDLISSAAPGSVYLGRPWKNHCAVTFLNCRMGAHIHPAGWAKWRREQHHLYCRYAEYNSMGPGASPDTRCEFSRQLDRNEALGYSLSRVLGGEDLWDPRY